MKGTLGRQDVIELLTELERRLAGQGVHADVYVVGGAAMALAYSRERLTRDIDAVFEPKALVYKEAQAMADERGLDPDWLNDGVKGLVPPNDPEPLLLTLEGGFRVLVASAKHLLAMKVAAARVERDTDDIMLLCRRLGLTTANQVLTVVEDVMPPAMSRTLTPKSRFLVEQLFANQDETELPAPDRRICGRVVPSTGLPCFLTVGHRGKHRSR